MSLKRMTLILVASAVSAIILGGCGPIYDTRYSYVPPGNPQGQTCVFQCENIKMQCEQLELMKAENCRNRARLDEDRCKDNIRRQGREPKPSECSQVDFCSADYDHCEERYRQCYQNCGGRVHAEQVCVFNCP